MSKASIDEFSQSNYLTQHDCDPKLLVTIARTDVETLNDGARKLVAYFEEQEKGLILSAKVNREAVAEITGSRDYTEWAGSRIVLYRDANVTGPSGARTGGIRIRAPQLRQAQPAAEAEPEFDDDIPFGDEAA